MGDSGVVVGNDAESALAADRPAAVLRLLVGPLVAARLVGGLSTTSGVMKRGAEHRPSPVLRCAIAEDAAGIADCVTRAYTPWVSRIDQTPAPMREDYAIVVRDRLVTVAEIADRSVGVLVLEPTSEGVLLENVAVCPDWQGYGIGSLLLRHAEAEARRLGHESLFLYTNQLMTENIALYARHGYVEYARRREDGFDRVYMRKAIAQAE
jgi:GNAT superfamily N-acetyltransferase